MIALSQLNPPQSRRTHRQAAPAVRIFAESGSVERDYADMVILIHRPDSYDRDDPEGVRLT